MTKLRRAGIVLGATLVALVSARAACLSKSRIPTPANIVIPSDPVVSDGPITRFGKSWMRKRGGIYEVSLEGEPAARGAAVSRLMREPMIADEGALYEAFKKGVPFAPARQAIMDLGRWRFRRVDQQIPAWYRDEVAGIAQGFQPDPFTSVLPSYHRFVFLYAVYDIALSFEKSPLIGCTTFTVPPKPTEAVAPEELVGDWEAATRGHAFLARAFDFEAGEPFDKDKVVFLVREPGRIPFASVGWPGFVGVVSGINRAGVALVVHGGRAGVPRPEGIPVVFSLREALSQAHTTDEAVKILSSHEVMVSHITIVTDSMGKTAVVERAPGLPAHVRWSTTPLATTNHFEGPLANDPRDSEVRAHTSTLARRTRGDAIVQSLPAAPGVVTMVSALRDRNGPDGKPLPLGDRRAIDALIATHGVVMDTTARTLWVSEWPHLLGRFVRFDLQRLLADGFDPSTDISASGGPGFAAVAADPLLTDGKYREPTDVRRLPLSAIAPGPRTLPPDSARYVARVLRLRSGDELEVFDPRAGLVALARITRLQADDVELLIDSLRVEPPSRPLVLVQGYPKGDKLGDIVRDATELGATLVIPAICERSVARPDAGKSASKVERLSTIAAEAARQCGRARAPEIAPPMPFADALALAHAHAEQGFVLWERATVPLGPSLSPSSHGVAFVIGPEGGLSEPEVQRAEALGYLTRSLGPIVLRTETAATAVLGAYRILGGERV